VRTIGCETWKCDRGWGANWYFLVFAEDHSQTCGNATSRWHWLAIVKAWWMARRLQKALAKKG